jgi:hypothetical protein
MLTPGSLLEPLVGLYHNAEIMKMTDDFVISKDTNARRKKSMLITIVLAFLAGLNSGNGLPHFITGITGQEHPSPLGNSAVVNLLEGWGAFLIGGIFWYFTWRQHGILSLCMPLRHLEYSPLTSFMPAFGVPILNFTNTSFLDKNEPTSIGLGDCASL